MAQMIDNFVQSHIGSVTDNLVQDWVSSEQSTGVSLIHLDINMF